VADRKRHELAKAALEACRTEVVRRLTAENHPLTIHVKQSIVVDNAEGNGWRSDHEIDTVSGLQDNNALMAARDQTVPNILIGFAEQLHPLADYLDKTTDLNNRPSPFMPEATGSEGIITRYLSRMAMQYLRTLKDLGKPEAALVKVLTTELDQFCDQARLTYLNQITVTGIKPKSQLTHRGVTLRPLSPRERGLFVGVNNSAILTWSIPGSDLALSHRFNHYMPQALITITSTRKKTEVADESTLPTRVVLAFFLKGFELGSNGVMSGFEQPQWAGIGTSFSPFPVGEKFSGQAIQQDISRKLFKEVVDLGYNIPAFGRGESSRREIVLSRVFQGFGAQSLEAGFLDFAIALEASLLGGSKTELAYKFGLYGALFLRNELVPSETFQRFKHVYRVRSKLVHGTRVSSEDRATANKDAKELARAVVLRAMETGWPDRKALDQLALDSGLHESAKGSEK
jgi:hypothetical protein